MEKIQRFLRRKKLLEEIDILLRGSVYHRDNDESEELPGTVMWEWDEEEGLVKVDDNP